MLNASGCDHHAPHMQGQKQSTAEATAAVCNGGRAGGLLLVQVDEQKTLLLNG